MYITSDSIYSEISTDALLYFFLVLYCSYNNT